MRVAAEAHAKAVEAQYRSIPPYLQRFDRWGFFTSQKVPVSLAGVNDGWPLRKSGDPYHRLDEPATWAAFGPVLASLVPGGAASKVRAISGPTFALGADVGAIVIDLDPVERNLPRGAHGGPHLLVDRMALGRKVTQWILNWAAQVGAYVEASSSGEGRHIIVRGTFAAYKYAIGWFGHIIRQDSHIHLTGNRLAGGDLVVAQAALDELIGFLLQCGAIREVQPPDPTASTLDNIETHGRRLDLTDAEVAAKLRNTNRKSFAALHSASYGGDWSEITWQIIGDLDKITGDAEQVARVLFASERLKRAGMSAGRVSVDRYERTSRIFNSCLGRARERNNKVFALRAEVAAENRARFGHLAG